MVPLHCRYWSNRFTDNFSHPSCSCIQLHLFGHLNTIQVSVDTVLKPFSKSTFPHLYSVHALFLSLFVTPFWKKSKCCFSKKLFDIALISLCNLQRTMTVHRTAYSCKCVPQSIMEYREICIPLVQIIVYNCCFGCVHYY